MAPSRQTPWQCARPALGGPRNPEPPTGSFPLLPPASQGPSCREYRSRRRVGIVSTPSAAPRSAFSFQAVQKLLIFERSRQLVSVDTTKLSGRVQILFGFYCLGHQNIMSPPESIVLCRDLQKAPPQAPPRDRTSGVCVGIYKARPRRNLSAPLRLPSARFGRAHRHSFRTQSGHDWHLPFAGTVI